MKNRFFGWLAASLVLLLSAGAAVSADSNASDRVGFTKADAEFYMPDSVYGFFRPGVVIHLVSIEIPDDLQPVVTFDLTDPAGAPLDIDGVLTPGPTTMYFMLDYIPQGEEYVVSYCTSAFCYDRGGELTTLSMGSYTYKFGTVLPDDYDADAPHTLSSVARRRFNDPEFAFAGLESDYIDNDIYTFIPSGGDTPMTRDVVRTESCNRCHNPLGMHGGQRFQEVRICLHCHNPDNLGEEVGEDGVTRSYALGPLVHRVHSNNEPELIDNGEVVEFPPDLNDCQVCHTGGTPTEDMPLVANPNPITSCGTGSGMTELSWIADGSVEIRIDSPDGKIFTMANSDGSKETGNWVREGREFFMVDKATGETLARKKAELTPYGCVTNPPYTYRGGVGAMHTEWMEHPNRAACGGCHVDVDFETGEGHIGGEQPNDDFCSFCHQADSGIEFDRSIAGAHQVELASSDLGGVIVEILNVANTGPGQYPTVTFSLKNKYGLLDPSELGRLLFTLTGPNEDYEFYAQENVLNSMVAVGNNWQYTFDTRVPMDAEGSYSVAFEGRIDVTLGNGETVRDSAENTVTPIAVTDAEPVARRQIVDDFKCESCHSNLSLHGDNRKNANEYCQTCHRPNNTDEEVRLVGEPESIHFKYMIHKIHRGADLENGFVVYGFRSSVHDYSDVEFPGDLRDCEACHLEDTYLVPLPEGAAPTESPATMITEMEPITATCLSCHDGDAVASHALANTSELGESCAACHGEGKTYGVERVHAR